jgi:fatty acid amide hydrolase 2
MSKILKLSVSKLAQKIRQGDLSSREVVETYIRHIKKVNPDLNAVVKERFHRARMEAKTADARVMKHSKKPLPPLHGVPCTIKECFSVKGMPNTSGLVARKNSIGKENATAVARLKQAGAIPLGVTNTSEMCFWFETYNSIYGRTNNPYNKKHIVGGSSGGEGAIVAAGGSPFGLGSDIGGSIRMPAFFNGIFGHKPTGGLVPNTGQFPFVDTTYLTTGPMTRYAEDLMPLLKILAGPDKKDPSCSPMKLGNPKTVKISQLTIYNIAENGFISVSSELQDIQQQCAQALAHQGAKVKRIKVKELKHSLEIWTSMIEAVNDIPIRNQLGNGSSLNIPLELARWLLNRSDHTFPALIVSTLEILSELSPSRKTRFYEMGEKLTEKLTQLLGQDGVILYPSFPTLAPQHYRTTFTPFHWIYAGIFNVMNFPVTQVPLGLHKNGLPLGIQVASAPGNDHKTIAVAMALEKTFGGWSPPFQLEN